MPYCLRYWSSHLMPLGFGSPLWALKKRSISPERILPSGRVPSHARSAFSVGATDSGDVSVVFATVTEAFSSRRGGGPPAAMSRAAADAARFFICLSPTKQARTKPSTFRRPLSPFGESKDAATRSWSFGARVASKATAAEVKASRSADFLKAKEGKTSSSAAVAAKSSPLVAAAITTAESTGRASSLRNSRIWSEALRPRIFAHALLSIFFALKKASTRRLTSGAEGVGS
mmetsp:Transcript_20910/g.54483  ORF Transcript_20910/g.54483 Transcript_20910/m.54483 type:complete len:231 (-) Transcript_20910:2018-2710(-)